ncbi:hypothetical protein [Nostoc sp. UHCC 0252]|nr:hypothetical protein [Nostoc sp. UHCC 0252]MEA5602263.1 hypothetical protein [Nostoc sp. UHCC 0252]
MKQSNRNVQMLRSLHSASLTRRYRDRFLVTILVEPDISPYISDLGN